MGFDVHRDGRKIEEHDDTTRIVTRWDHSGKVIESRPYTAREDEIADRETGRRLLVGNRGFIEGQVRAFLAANGPSRQYLDASSPTQAQTVAQMKRNTRALFALLKFHFGEFDDTDGT